MSQEQTSQPLGRGTLSDLRIKFATAFSASVADRNFLELRRVTPVAVACKMMSPPQIRFSTVFWSPLFCQKTSFPFD